MTYSWTFVDGNPPVSTIQNPIVNYNQSGSYPVTPVMTNAFGSDTSTSTAMAGNLPTSLFSEQISNNNVQFTFTELTNIVKFGTCDGATSTEVNPNHTYLSTSGLYNVMLITSKWLWQ
ncbi:MAG: PKD domain-containing protein [Saprospiraceae bacterium]